jgi:hypothetical protein
VNDLIRYHFDEHIPTVVAKGLRQYSIDVTMPVDVGLIGARDIAHLEYSRISGRVMVTYDSDFVKIHNSGQEHSGIVYVLPRSRAIGTLIELLRLVREAFLPDEMLNHLEYL